MRIRKKHIIIAIFLGSYIFYAVMTGGVVIYNHKTFGGQRNIRLAEGLKSDIWVDSSPSSLGIPFIGFYYYTKLPCSLRIQIWDRSQKYSKISISNIWVQYADGKTKNFPVQWQKDLKPYIRHTTSSSGLIKTPMMMLSDFTPKVVEKYSDLSVTFKGLLETKDHKTIPFRVTEEFRFKKDFGIFTFWAVIASF